jgi:oligosaccharide repeat unit polymerase
VNRQAQVIVISSGIRGVWWLNPAVAFGLPAVIAGSTAYNTDSTDYLHHWGTAKYFDLSCFLLLIAVVIAFVCGCLFGVARRRESVIRATDWTLAVRWEWVRLLFRLSFILTLLAYGIWFAVGIKNGLNLSIIVDAIRGTADSTSFRKEYLATIPGVTTATQFGLAVIALGVPLGAATGWRAVRWQCLIVFALALVRAFLNSERLAVIELLVPFIVSFVWLRPARSRPLRLLTQSAPIAASMLLFLFFGAMEYFRSWTAFYSHRESSFWGFIGLRLMGYYTTALNNGALLWKANQVLSLRLPLATLKFIGRFPILKDLISQVYSPFLGYLFGSVPSLSYYNLLSTSANPEFNNPGGVFSPIVDYGLAGGLLYWLLCGLICGYLYKEFKLRSVAGVFLYPALYISLLEVTRAVYWADGRFFPGMFLLVVGVLFLFRKPATPAASVPSLAAETMAV